MNEAHKERILDAFLEEVLGGQYPPDLTAKILQTWQARHGEVRPDDAGFAASLAPLPPPPDAAGFPPVARPVQFEVESSAEEYAEPLAEPVRRSRPQRTSRAPWWWLAFAAGTLAAGVSLLVYVVQDQPFGSVARVEANKEHEAKVPPHPQRPDRSVTTNAQKLAGRPPQRPVREQRPTPALAWRPAPAGNTRRELPRPERKVAKPLPDTEVIAFVNQVLKQSWREHGVTASPPLSDSQWSQCVYQRLVGREPTKEEHDRFMKSKDANKRQQLVDQLLAGDEYANHWANFWTGALLGSASPQGSAADRAALSDYLQQSLRANKPYNQLVVELLSAQGSNQPEAKDYNGAVGFLAAGAADHALAATDRTARVFLGRQLVCTQCHDQPTAGREQGEFWQLNAFFRQMHVRRDRGQEVAVLADADFPGESGAAKDAEIFYRLPDGRLRIAYPAVNGYEIAHSGLLQDVRRRDELAQLVVAADEFPRAVVNRLWANLLGYGFVQPVDDLGPHNPPAYPEVLDRLADQLAAHQFDLKTLTRWIVLSEPFGLSGRRMPESWMDAPEKGGQPLFARGYLQGEPPRDVYRSLMLAVNSRPKNLRIARTPVTAGTYGLKTWTNSSNLEIIEPQAVEPAPGNGWLELLAASSLKPERKVEHVFLAALGRLPTPREMTAAKLLLADRLNDAVALPEVWRTLLAGGGVRLERWAASPAILL